MSRMQPEQKNALAKEWLLLLAGLGGIAYQLLTDKVNIALLMVFTTMTGLPMLARLFFLIRNSPIILQSSSSPPEYPELASGKSSLGSGAEDE